MNGCIGGSKEYGRLEPASLFYLSLKLFTDFNP